MGTDGLECGDAARVVVAGVSGPGEPQWLFAQSMAVAVLMLEHERLTGRPYPGGHEAALAVVNGFSREHAVRLWQVCQERCK